MKAKLVKGEKLTPQQVQQVKSAFGYRWTIENMPRALQRYKSTSTPTMESVSDAQWLKEHAFYIKSDGTLASKPNHCEPAFMAE